MYLFILKLERGGQADRDRERDREKREIFYPLVDSPNDHNG